MKANKSMPMTQSYLICKIQLFPNKKKKKFTETLETLKLHPQDSNLRHEFHGGWMYIYYPIAKIWFTHKFHIYVQVSHSLKTKLTLLKTKNKNKFTKFFLQKYRWISHSRKLPWYPRYLMHPRNQLAL